MTTVSVIIATWNRSASLERAIRSALCQTHSPLEVLVCDDGSIDDTEQVVRSIRDSRVVWLPGERAGRPAVPRNRGIRASQGEWIAFLDDDDLWLPEKIERQLLGAARFSAQAVCSDAWRVGPGSVGSELMIGGVGCRLTFSDLLRGNGVICSSMMVKKEIFKMASGFPEHPNLAAIEDYALWLRIADITAIAYVASPLLNYFDSPETSIRSKGITVYQQRKMVMNDFIAWRSGARFRYSSSQLKAMMRLTVEWVQQSLKDFKL